MYFWVRSTQHCPVHRVVCINRTDISVSLAATAAKSMSRTNWVTILSSERAADRLWGWLTIIGEQSSEDGGKEGGINLPRMFKSQVNFGRVRFISNSTHQYRIRHSSHSSVGFGSFPKARNLDRKRYLLTSASDLRSTVKVSNCRQLWLCEELNIDGPSEDIILSICDRVRLMLFMCIHIIVWIHNRNSDCRWISRQQTTKIAHGQTDFASHTRSAVCLGGSWK